MKKIILIAIIALFGVKIAAAHPRPVAVVVVKERCRHFRNWEPIVVLPAPPIRPVVAIMTPPQPVILMPPPPRFIYRHYHHRM